MIKILVVGSLPIDLKCFKNGVETIIFSTLEGFSVNNLIQVKVFSLTHETTKIKKIGFSNNISIEYYPYGFTRSTKLGTFINGRRFLKKVVKNFDPNIIHFQGNGSLLLLSLGMNSKKLVITPHGMLKEEYKYAQKFITKINFIMAICIETLLIKKFNYFIFISNYAKNYFLKTYVHLNSSHYKYDIIANPLTQKFFSETIYTHKVNNIIFIGSIIPRKGLDLLLSAIAIIKKDVHTLSLTVVGDFKDDIYKDSINLQINNLNISELVTFAGWQKQETVHELLKKSDCLVLPSHQETLPVSIMEAMAMGKIVVSSNVGGCSEMIKNNVNGFIFKKGDLDDLTSVLFKIIRFKNLRNVAKNAHLSAIENYQSNQIIEKIIAFYHSMMRT